MRIGNSRSASYRRLKARHYQRKCIEIEKLCRRLDKLTARFEKLKSGHTRASLVAMADKVREKLRILEH